MYCVCYMERYCENKKNQKMHFIIPINIICQKHDSESFVKMPFHFFITNICYKYVIFIAWNIQIHQLLYNTIALS